MHKYMHESGDMMKVKEMIGALQLHKKNTDSHQLMTVWGEHLDCTKVLEEYPRPQMVRSNYTILKVCGIMLLLPAAECRRSTTVRFWCLFHLNLIYRVFTGNSSPKSSYGIREPFIYRRYRINNGLFCILGHVTSDAGCISMVHRQDFIRADIRHFHGYHFLYHAG